MLEHARRRVRYAIGNWIRFVSKPWRQSAVALNDARSIFGCSFGLDGWHHLRETLQQVDLNPQIDPLQTVLANYLRNFCPLSICELAGLHEQAALPLFVYPWGTFKRGQVASDKDPWQSRFCGPSTDEFIKQEFYRTLRLYKEISERGYHPTVFPNSFIGGTWLVAASGEKRFIVLQGNHRMAILSHLGYEEIQVRALRGHWWMIRETDVADWPLVKSGRCSQENALAIFKYFFVESGYTVQARSKSTGTVLATP